MRKYAYNYWSGGAGLLAGGAAGNAASGWLADRMGLKEPTSFGGRLARFGIKTLGTVGGAVGGAMLGKTNWGPGGNQTAKEVPIAAIERAAGKKAINAAVAKARVEKANLRSQFNELFPHKAADDVAFNKWYKQQRKSTRAYDREQIAKDYDRMLTAEYKARGFERGQQTTGSRGLAAKGHNWLSDYATLGGDIASLGFGAMTIGGLGSAGYGLYKQLANKRNPQYNDYYMQQAIPDGIYQQTYDYNG